jgi:integrase
MFNHAKTNNSARGVRRFADEKRNKVLSLDDIAALGRAMREAEAGGASKTGIAVIRALLLTGCRKAEILTLTQDQIKAKERYIHFADTKSGPQMRPLGLAAIKHLSGQAKRGDWVFPADRGDGHFIGVAGVLADLCRRAKLADVSPHTLRHTFGSIAGTLNYSELTIAGLLGHAARSVTGDYVHLGPDGALLAAANAVADRIAAALELSVGADVVVLRGAR